MVLLPPAGTERVTNTARGGEYPYSVSIRNIYGACTVLGRLDCHTLGYVCENVLSMGKAMPMVLLFVCLFL